MGNEIRKQKYDSNTIENTRCNSFFQYYQIVLF